MRRPSPSLPIPSSVARYGVDPRDPLGREDLARAEGRRMEGVSQEDLGRDAEAIEQLMESVLAVEKKEKEKTKVGPFCCCSCVRIFAARCCCLVCRVLCSGACWWCLMIK